MRRVPRNDDGDDDYDGESVTSSNHSPKDPPPPGAASVAGTSGSVIDQMDTQPVEGHEPTIEPVSCGDSGLAAREDLAARLRAQPTPARRVKVWGLPRNLKASVGDVVGVLFFARFFKIVNVISPLQRHLKPTLLFNPCCSLVWMLLLLFALGPLIVGNMRTYAHKRTKLYTHHAHMCELLHFPS